jgi:hypothetical protein
VNIMTQRLHRHHHPTPRQARIALAVHAATYVAVNVVLAAINLRSGDDLWFPWLLLGWGAGLAWHTWVVVSHVGLRGPAHQSHGR